MTVTSDWTHETLLAAEPVSASKARDFVCMHLQQHDLVFLAEDMRLVASELATNAVAHAQTQFLVTLSQANGSVRLAVQDESSSVPVKAEPDLLDMNGRGLMLVELLSTQWGTDTNLGGLKSVWASFDSEELEGDPHLTSA